jgi:hypothetical protein
MAEKDGLDLLLWATAEMKSEGDDVYGRYFKRIVQCFALCTRAVHTIVQQCNALFTTLQTGPTSYLFPWSFVDATTYIVAFNLESNYSSRERYQRRNGKLISHKTSISR